jgi:hypothetical protein
VITVEDWADIHRLHRAETMPIKAIAWKLKISKNRVPADAGDGDRRADRGGSAR